MQIIKLFKRGSYNINTHKLGEEKLAETFVGAIRSDVSPMGVICIQDYLGKQTVVSLDSYSRMETTPMEDEEILATPGLGEWFQERMDEATAKAAAPEEITH